MWKGDGGLCFLPLTDLFIYQTKTRPAFKERGNVYFTWIGLGNLLLDIKETHTELAMQGLRGITCVISGMLIYNIFKKGSSR